MLEPVSYHYFEDVNQGLLRLWGDRRGLDVLDIACGFATTAAEIERRGNRVTGLDSSADAVAVARTRLSRVVQADLQDFDAVVRELAGARFDVLIFADVLEHLAWPAGVLKQYLALLKPGGSVIVSLPNIGLWSVRLQHLVGKFEYEDTGVLDRTHLRFFTRRSALRLLDDAGLRPTRRTYNPGMVRPFVPLVKKMIGGDAPTSILESRPYRLYLKAVHPIEAAFARLWPGMLAFQMIFEAVPK